MDETTQEILDLMHNINTATSYLSGGRDLENIFLAICLKNIEMAYHSGFEKPQFLAFISNLWESIQNLVEDNPI